MRHRLVVSVEGGVQAERTALFAQAPLPNPSVAVSAVQLELDLRLKRGLDESFFSQLGKVCQSLLFEVLRSDRTREGSG